MTVIFAASDLLKKKKKKVFFDFLFFVCVNLNFSVS